MPLLSGERTKKYREKKKLTDLEFLVKEAETGVPRSVMLLNINVTIKLK